MSSTYFIKVRAKSKKQDVDTFIQKLLDSEKFDEFADKIAIKAVQRINDNKEAEKRLRSAFDAIDETHRSAANKKKKEETMKLPIQQLTSGEKKTTVISLKYKRFTQNILDEDNAINEDTNRRNKTTSESDAKKNKSKYYDDQNETKEISSTENSTAKYIKIDDEEFTADKVTSVSNNTTAKDSGGNDDDEKFEKKMDSKKSTQVPTDDDDDNISNKVEANIKKLVALQKTDDEDESDFINKRENEKYTDADISLQRKETYSVIKKEHNKSNERTDNEYEDDEIVSRAREQKQNDDSTADNGPRKHQPHKKNKYTNNKKRVDRANDADKSDKYEDDEDNRVLKDNGNADAEEDKDKYSTEERLSNNKILVRREGNTLYAQNLAEYDEYRDQLAKGAKDRGAEK